MFTWFVVIILDKSRNNLVFYVSSLAQVSEDLHKIFPGPNFIMQDVDSI